MQKLTGIHSILGYAWVYEAFMSLIGAKRKREILVKDYIRPKEGMRMLDCGCGPAEILSTLPQVEYLGVDLSKDYIDKARAKFGHRGQFAVQSVNEIAVSGRKFDFAMALGLVHHLDDTEVVAMFKSIRSVLVPGGRFITQDGVYVDRQSMLARFILNNDRGKNVRWENEYKSLAEKVFGSDNVVVQIRYDLTRIPYTHIIMECKVPK